MSTDFDVLIIGAGVSGSIAGAYLAKGGLRTALFEGSNLVGGPKYSGYTVEGVHADLTHIPYWGMRWNGGNGWWVRAAEEVGATITFQCLPNSAFYSGGMIAKVPYCTSGKAFARFFCSLIPLDIPEETQKGLAEIFDAAASMPEEKLWSPEMDVMPASNWIDSITDDEFARLLMGSLAGMMLCIPSDIALEKVSARMMIGSLLTGLFGGRANMVSMIGGACDMIPRAFCEVAADHGAQMLLNHRVNRVIIEDGRAVGAIVETPSGQKTYRADQVIIATEYGSYPGLLGDHLPSQIGETIKAFDAVPFTSLDVHFLLNRPIISPAWSFLAFISADGQFTGLVGSIPHFDPGAVPEGKQLLQMQTFKPTEEYQTRTRDEWIEQLLDTCEEVYPGVRDAIEWRHAVEMPQPFQYQNLPVTKIPLACPGIASLYFTGDCTEAPSFVTDRAAASAMMVAKAILER